MDLLKVLKLNINKSWKFNLANKTGNTYFQIKQSTSAMTSQICTLHSMPVFDMYSLQSISFQCLNLYYETLRHWLICNKAKRLTPFSNFIKLLNVAVLAKNALAFPLFKTCSQLFRFSPENLFRRVFWSNIYWIMYSDVQLKRSAKQIRLGYFVWISDTIFKTDSNMK